MRRAAIGAWLAVTLTAAGAQAPSEQPEVLAVAPVAADADATPATQAVHEPSAAPVAAGDVPEDEAPSVAAERELDRGIASWYGPGLHGRRTANGERFDQHALTAAHRSLPFGTVVRVRSLVNGRTVDVRINDRGPFLKRRIIDLSRAAAAALGLIDSRRGVKPVAISVLEPATR